MNRIYNKKELKNRRQELRNNSTYAEIVLWKHLQKSQLEGRKFRRQHSISSYIVDFYCPSERLVVELDGEDHFTPEGIAHDKKRTEYITGLFIREIRFENQDVLYNLEYVLKTIKDNFK